MEGGACVELNAQGHEELAERLREVLQGEQRPEPLWGSKRGAFL
jgi:hypothetical protein